MADKILCPRCGAEMRSVLELVRNRAGSKIAWNAHMECRNWNCQADGLFMQIPSCATKEDAGEKLRAVMRSYMPMLRPMTLPEVRRENSAWLEVNNKRWKLRFIEMTKRSGGVVFQLAGSKELHGVLYDTYGKDWRCWSRKPTGEERSAAEWVTSR